MKIKETIKLTSYKWLNLFLIMYNNEKKKDDQFHLVASRNKELKCTTKEYDEPDAVIIVAVHPDTDRIVLTREYRVAIGDYEYGFPAGLVNPGESVVMTAKRELMEETGLKLTRITHVTPPIYSSPGMTDESVVIVYGICKGEPSTDLNEDPELIDILMVSIGELRDLMRDKSLKFGAKAWLILEWFVERGYF